MFSQARRVESRLLGVMFGICLGEILRVGIDHRSLLLYLSFAQSMCGKITSILALPYTNVL